MSHPAKAREFVRDKERAKWHDDSLWFVRKKRDRSANELPEWEELRKLASQIKDHTLSHLDTYLESFETSAKKNGVQVHWAADAREHNEIIAGILKTHNFTKVVKSKSMLTEECHLNEHLEAQNIEVVDTDLGERIIQLVKEPPSHIVMPAIHKKKEEISTIFEEHLHTEPGNNDPQYLTNAARLHLREKFLSAEAAISGVNFGIAETGGVVVCTNEGNADFGINRAKVHIACMGIEKLIPKAKDLGVFLRLLARSATGQLITTYSSHFHKPRADAEMHIVIVDNGRSEHLGRDDYYRSLRCIRCGACMNTCPIYRRSGGHSYEYTVPGPIGSILSPGRDMKKYSSLPFASTLCGSCSDVCPVKIDIHDQLYKWRQEIVEHHQVDGSKKAGMRIAEKVLSRPHLYAFLGKVARWSLRNLPSSLINNPLNVWGRSRDLPDAPKESFQDWYKKRKP